MQVVLAVVDGIVAHPHHHSVFQLLASQPQEYPRDPGQRAVCLCVPCKDVGQYDTCPHGCVYCYANTSPATAARNFRQHDPAGESIVAEL